MFYCNILISSLQLKIRVLNSHEMGCVCINPSASYCLLDVDRLVRLHLDLHSLLWGTGDVIAITVGVGSSLKLGHKPSLETYEGPHEMQTGARVIMILQKTPPPPNHSPEI